MSLSSEYDIRLMQADDYDQVLSLLTNSYYPDEPLARCLQMTEGLKYSKAFLDDYIRAGYSFVASDKATNRIVATILNDVRDRNIEYKHVSVDEKSDYLFRLLDHIHEKSNVFDHLKVDKLFHLDLLSVDRKLRGRELGSRLISKSIDYARELKFEGAYAVATNRHSLNCLRQHQFQILSELIYVDYDGLRLATLNGPYYDRCYLVTRKFQSRNYPGVSQQKFRCMSLL